MPTAHLFRAAPRARPGRNGARRWAPPPRLAYARRRFGNARDRPLHLRGLCRAARAYAPGDREPAALEPRGERLIRTRPHAGPARQFQYRLPHELNCPAWAIYWHGCEPGPAAYPKRVLPKSRPDRLSVFDRTSVPELRVYR